MQLHYKSILLSTIEETDANGLQIMEVPVQHCFTPNDYEWYTIISKMVPPTQSVPLLWKVSWKNLNSVTTNI